MKISITKELLSCWDKDESYLSVTDMSRITKFHRNTISSYCRILARHGILSKKRFKEDMRKKDHYKITEKGKSSKHMEMILL